MMDERIKKRWVKALRSGKYNQVTDALKATVDDDDLSRPAQKGFCCLGVLCDVSGRGEWDGDDNFHFKLRKEDAKGYGLLSNKVIITGSLTEDYFEVQYQEGFSPDRDGTWGRFKNTKKNKAAGLKDGEFIGILEYFGIPTKEHTKLIGMNDGGKSFDEIADYIERKL